MSYILIVDDAAIIREPIAGALRSAGYETGCAGCGSAALEMLQSRVPELMLLDVSMPGMDGMEVLRRLRTNPATEHLPVILLTATADRTLVLRAAKLGVRDYMLKSSFNIKELLVRVCARLSSVPAAAEVAPPAVPSVPVECRQSVLTREQTLHAIEKAEVKSLPGAVSELIGLTSSARATAHDISQCVKRAPTLTARLLRVANSAAFTSNRARISSIEDAVRHVGLKQIRNLATSAGVLDTLATEKVGSEMLRTWQHSVAVAMLMELLVPEDSDAPTGMNYVVGLCHDLPELLLCQHLPEQQAYCTELARRSGKSASHHASEVFGMSFSELIDLLLPRLGLPPTVILPIREYFEHGPHRLAAQSASLLSRQLFIANQIAHGMMLSPTVHDPVRSFSKSEIQETLGTHLPSIDHESMRGEIVSTSTMLVQLSSAELDEATKPPIGPAPFRVRYVRDAKDSPLDPLHILLQMLAGSVTLEKLSTVNESFQKDSVTVIVCNGSPDTVTAKYNKILGSPTLCLTSLDPGNSAPPPAGMSIRPLPTTARMLADAMAQLADAGKLRAA